MPVRKQPRLAIAILSLLVVALAGCGTVGTAICGLSGYAADLQVDLEELGAMDPELVSQAGTPENLAALTAIDDLDATRARAQDALDAASEDEVGPALRRAFQAALDATELATTELRAAIESGDAAAVSDALSLVQRASEAIDTFLGLVQGLEIDCDVSSSASASEVASASEATSPSASPSTESAAPTESPRESEPTTPSPSPTPSPTAPSLSPTPTSTPSPTPSASPSPTPTTTPTPSPSPTATASQTPSPSPTPSATPTSTPTASPSASASASASVEPSPSPSGAPSEEDGSGTFVWLTVLGLGAVGAGALAIWIRSRSEPEPTDGPDGSDEMAPPEDMPPGAPPTSPTP